MTDGLNRINNPIAELQQRTAQKVFDLNNEIHARLIQDILEVDPADFAKVEQKIEIDANVLFNKNGIHIPEELFPTLEEEMAKKAMELDEIDKQFIEKYDMFVNNGYNPSEFAYYLMEEYDISEELRSVVENVLESQAELDIEKDDLEYIGR